VTQVVSTAQEVAELVVPNPNKVAYLTQTTLSLDEARTMIDALKRKFPSIAGPHAQDICYATENRQVAVKKVAPGADLPTPGALEPNSIPRNPLGQNNLPTRAASLTPTVAGCRSARPSCRTRENADAKAGWPLMFS